MPTQLDLMKLRSDTFEPPSQLAASTDAQMPTSRQLIVYRNYGTRAQLNPTFSTRLGCQRRVVF
jgi:hypothetical protein